MNKELKPCPHCGGKMILKKIDRTWFILECERCPLTFGRYRYTRESNIIYSWNRPMKKDGDQDA